MRFGNLPPKDKKAVQKKAIELHAEVSQAKDPDFSKTRIIEMFSKAGKGHLELPVRVLHNRVLDDRGQVIVKVTA
ncbi:hypothetical protein HZA44_02185 [Candidatus Peregrinibacteria bacterium]|nr:hypothetical protein [Candidatus Peregrinibacteria bacterium]